MKPLKQEIKPEEKSGGKHIPLSFERLISLPIATLDHIASIYGIPTKSTDSVGEKIARIIEASKQSIPAEVETLVNSYTNRRAFITIDYTRTVNTGNYNSVKVGGGVSIPVDYTPSEFNEAMKKWRETYQEMQKVVDEECKNILQ